MPLSTTAPRRRWPFVFMLLGSLAWLGLVAGTAVGAAWFVPEGSGLAGPAIALGYGVLGLFVGLALGSVLGWKAGHGLLRSSTAVAVVLALLTAGLVVWRVVSVEAERRAAAGLDVLLPPPGAIPATDRQAVHRPEHEVAVLARENLAVEVPAAGRRLQVTSPPQPMHGTLAASDSNAIPSRSTGGSETSRRPAPEETRHRPRGSSRYVRTGQ